MREHSMAGSDVYAPNSADKSALMLAAVKTTPWAGAKWGRRRYLYMNRLTETSGAERTPDGETFGSPWGAGHYDESYASTNLRKTLDTTSGSGVQEQIVRSMD